MEKAGSEKIDETTGVYGKYVKINFTFLCRQKKNINNYHAGIVVGCYDNFALVEFEHYKKCFAYDEIEEISKEEYKRLLYQKAVNHEFF